MPLSAERMVYSVPEEANRSSDPSGSDRDTRLAQLESERAELVARLPKHSVTAALLIRIEELEDEIAALRAETNAESTTTADRCSVPWPPVYLD